jgi:choline dehydrogenase-like flavoprotein
LAKPNVILNLLDDERDMQAMVALMRKCIALAQTRAMKKIIKGPVFPPAMLAKHGCTALVDGGNHDVVVVSDEFLMDFIRHYAMPLYHPTSTCKIGKVVDPQLKVLGIKGLRVADASVFPTNISGNTNAPSIMVGEMAAELIKKEYSLQSVAVCMAPVPCKVPWALVVVVGALAVAGAAGLGLAACTRSRK